MVDDGPASLREGEPNVGEEDELELAARHHPDARGEAVRAAADHAEPGDQLADHDDVGERTDGQRRADARSAGVETSARRTVVGRSGRLPGPAHTPSSRRASTTKRSASATSFSVWASVKTAAVP